METNSATDKAISYARALVREREWSDRANGNIFERCMDLSESEQTRFIGARECSQVIDFLKTCPRTKGEQPEIGIYVLEDGAIVQAKQNQRKTNVYTKLWVGINGERLTLAGERQHGEWEYQPQLKEQLATARRMTLDEAKQFILIYGKCVRCGRTLKAANSVERGIGPICIQYFSQFG